MGPRIVRRLTVGVAVAGLALPALAGQVGSAAAASSAAGIHPGSVVNFGDVTCEVGAVLRQGKGVFLAVPASCGGIDLGKAQDGCSAPVTPVGVPASIGGASRNGLVVYNSFSEMQRSGIKDPNRCYYNDLALIRVNRHDRHLVSAAVPGVGTPSAVLTKLPGSGAALRLGKASGTSGATHHAGWEVDATTMATFKTWQAGAPVTIGRKLVGMLIVLPKGPIPMVPLMQAPAQVYNLARSIALLRATPGFHHIHLAS